MSARTRHLVSRRRREYGNLAMLSLIIALLITIMVFGALAHTAVNTGAALGFGFVAAMAMAAAVMLFIEGRTS